MATRGAEPSPTVKIEPRAVVNLKVPRRTNRPNSNFSSRSIGRTFNIFCNIFWPLANDEYGGRFPAYRQKYRRQDVLLD